MKSLFKFDFTEHDYGPATPSIRQLMSEWSEMEWPAPPRIPRQDAHRLFAEHQRLVSSYLPTKLAQRVEIAPVTGGWAEFAALCKKVRTENAWDWKFSGLKPVERAHSEAHGWTKEEELRQLRAAPDLGNLLLPLGETVCWVIQWSWPDFRVTAGEHDESARFYYEYCAIEFTQSIEWQLAEPGAKLEQNPFHLLLRLYAAGYYPFSMGPDSVVMFSFAQPA